MTLYEGNSLNAFAGRLGGQLVSATLPIPRLLYTATASATVANTTAETSIIGTGIGSLSMPATAVEALPVTTVPFWFAGKTIRVRVMGYISQLVAGPNRTVKIYLGSTALGTVGPSSVATAVTNVGFLYEFLTTCRTTGATGTAFTQGTLFHSGLGQNYMNATSAVTIDTTTAAALDVKFTWGTGDPGNTITATNVTVEALN